jgi:hypothetical protein
MTFEKGLSFERKGVDKAREGERHSGFLRDHCDALFFRWGLDALGFILVSGLNCAVILYALLVIPSPYGI